MDTAKFLADLRAQRERINQAITALEALGDSTPSLKSAKTAAPRTKANTTTKRVISSESRQRMAEAQQKRWAKKKRAAKAAAATV